jgi:hypothetical protein
LLDHAREVAFRRADGDPSQVGDVRRGHGYLGFKQHLQDQLFKLVEVHGYVLRVAHAKLIDHGEPHARDAETFRAATRWRGMEPTRICVIGGDRYRHEAGTWKPPTVQKAGARHRESEFPFAVAKLTEYFLSDICQTPVPLEPRPPKGAC